MRVNFITGLICLLPFIGFSQGEFNKWYFGANAGIDFNSTPPSSLPASAMNTLHASVSVADSLGNLLFYSHGLTVYNRNHQIMPNGGGLLGDQLTQGVFTVKKPGEDNIYYLFTINNTLFPVTYGLYYSLIDMNLNGGLGDVVTGVKNIVVSGAEDVFCGIHGTRHLNNRDAWIVVRKFTTNQYAAYRITSSGISIVPVLSACSLPSCDGFSCGNNVMKISQDGSRYVFVSHDPVQNIDIAELGIFNNQTGVLSPLFQFRPVNLVLENPLFFEFSPDSKLLYAVSSFTPDNRLVFQYNLASSDSIQFMQSQLLIASPQAGLALQLGTDGKIYQCVSNIDSLNVINNPNVQGLGCNFQSNAIALASSTFNHSGLPQFLQRYKAYLHYNGSGCQSDSLHFSGDIWPPADTTRWNFGDPASGGSNVSYLANSAHLFSTPGTYTIELYVRHNDNRTDTTWRTITIYPSPAPLLGPDRMICAGSSTTFDAGFCSGCIYEWKNVGSGLIVGTNQTFATGTSGIYCVNVTNGNGCTGKDTVQLITTPVPVVTNNPPLLKSICTGESTNIPLFGNEPGILFHWTATLTSGNISGFTADSGLVVNQILINNGATAGVVTYHITPKIGDCVGTPVDYAVTVNVGDPVDITIAASGNAVCAGIPVTFTATPVNPGNTPVYQWKVNFVNAGSNAPMYAYAPANGDIVTCILTSSNTVCTSNNPATSNAITMVVNATLPAGITISASANPFCPGSAVTFTATPMNGGSTPVYQWKVNGTNAGTNSSTFTYNPQNNDSVRCILTCNLNCVTGNPVSSAKIIMSGTLAPVVTFTPCFDTITTVGAKPFRLKGGIPLGGAYSGPGVNSLAGVFNPALAGVGKHTITYSYTNAYGCEASTSVTIVTRHELPFVCGNTLTDIRDGKTYPTVQIGSQCWMASNLEYGMTIDELVPQMDNCIAERYSPHPSVLNSKFDCSTVRLFNFSNLKSEISNLKSEMRKGALYQWDELMQYQSIEGVQGLCPPGWHVPTETEWTTLLNFYQGAGRAGRPLQDTVVNGFSAMMGGFNYSQRFFRFDDFATMFWSSTPSGSERALAYGMNTWNFSVSLYPAGRGNAFGVRCLRD